MSTPNGRLMRSRLPDRDTVTCSTYPQCHVCYVVLCVALITDKMRNLENSAVYYRDGYPRCVRARDAISSARATGPQSPSR